MSKVLTVFLKFVNCAEIPLTTPVGNSMRVFDDISYRGPAGSSSTRSHRNSPPQDPKMHFALKSLLVSRDRRHTLKERMNCPVLFW